MARGIQGTIDETYGFWMVTGTENNLILSSELNNKLFYEGPIDPELCKKLVHVHNETYQKLVDFATKVSEHDQDLLLKLWYDE